MVGQDRRGGQRQIGCTWLEWLGCRSKPRLGMLEVTTIMTNPWSSFLPLGSSYDCWVRDSIIFHGRGTEQLPCIVAPRCTHALLSSMVAASLEDGIEFSISGKRDDLLSLFRCPGSLEGQSLKDSGKRIFPQYSTTGCGFVGRDWPGSAKLTPSRQRSQKMALEQQKRATLW